MFRWIYWQCQRLLLLPWQGSKQSRGSSRNSKVLLQMLYHKSLAPHSLHPHHYPHDDVDHHVKQHCSHYNDSPIRRQTTSNELRNQFFLPLCTRQPSRYSITCLDQDVMMHQPCWCRLVMILEVTSRWRLRWKVVLARIIWTWIGTMMRLWPCICNHFLHTDYCNKVKQQNHRSSTIFLIIFFSHADLICFVLLVPLLLPKTLACPVSKHYLLAPTCTIIHAHFLHHHHPTS